MVGRVLRHLVLVGVVGLALGSGVAWADPTEAPGEVEQPRPLVAAAAGCADGAAEVTVIVYEDRDEPFEVTVASVNGPFSVSGKTTLDEEHLVHTTAFDDVPVGEYVVGVAGAEGPADGVRVLVKPCTDPGPGADALTVEVECKAGWGIVTFVVTNPKTGKTTSHTLTVDGIPAYELEVSPGLFLRVTENGYDDGKHTARLTGEGVDVSVPFTVACEKGNAAGVDVGVKCAGEKGTVSVGVRNPNRAAVDYEVTLKGQTKSASVGGGERGVVSFADVPDGDHPVLVTGSDKTDVATLVEVKCTPPPTTTTTTATTTTTTTSTTTTTTTAAPVPQGRSGGGLARTGSAVGEMVGLGALALVGGGALVLLARRRRARHE